MSKHNSKVVAMFYTSFGTKGKAKELKFVCFSSFIQEEPTNTFLQGILYKIIKKRFINI